MSSEVRGLPFSCNTSEEKLQVVTCRAGAASKERLEKAYEDYSTDTKLEPARPPTTTITTYVTLTALWVHFLPAPYSYQLMCKATPGETTEARRGACLHILSLPCCCLPPC
jgi:hypothetical protein